jgi:hypothetical protein
LSFLIVLDVKMSSPMDVRTGTPFHNSLCWIFEVFLGLFQKNIALSRM